MSEDIKLCAKVRKVIISNWFDISAIRVRVTRGVIYLQGRVRRATDNKDDRDGSKETLRKLDEDLRALSGFRGVTYSFDNWVREMTGAWRPLDAELMRAIKKKEDEEIKKSRRIGRGKGFV